MKETIIYMALISTMNILCFFIGGKVAQMMYKNKEIKLIPNPIEKIKEVKADKEYDKEELRIRTIAENIDNYDGTGMYQKEL